jgi:hypothetical protein
LIHTLRNSTILGIAIAVGSPGLVVLGGIWVLVSAVRVVAYPVHAVPVVGYRRLA